MTIHTNGGKLSTTKKGIFSGFGEVWYHPDATANILSFSNFRDKFEISYDERKDRFAIHKK